MESNSIASMPESQLQEYVEGTKTLMPFNPPEAVRHWLRPEDWEVLNKAWADAESQAAEWTTSELTDAECELVSQELRGSSSGPRRRSRNRRHWDEKWSLLGNDHGLPPTLRRYFDDVPKEISSFKEAVRPGLRQLPDQRFADEGKTSPGTKPWDYTHTSLASTDNRDLHPFLRHYFDTRGLEASYRLRPHVDHEVFRQQPKRPFGRPPTAQKLARWNSEPSLSSAKPEEEEATITWGGRCLLVGPDAAVRASPTGGKIPWVRDHHRSETEDNKILPPMMRHYFDSDGYFGSFRNRGRHYGRPLPSVFGQSFQKKSGTSTMSALSTSSGPSHSMKSLKHR